MSETKDAKDDDKSEGKGRKTLHLKKNVDAGQVRQRAASRGSTVVVQRKKRRLVNKEEAKGEGKAASAQDSQTAASAGTDEDVKLTSAEQQRRAKVLEQARKAEEEKKVREAEEEARRKEEAEAEARQKAEEEKKAAEEAAQAATKAPEDAADGTSAEAEAAAQPSESSDTSKEAGKAAGKSAKPAGEEAPPPPRDDKPDTRKPKPISAKQREAIELEEEERARRSRSAPKPAPRSEPRRRGKLTVSRALQDEGEERQRSLAAYRRAQRKQRKAQGGHEERQKVRREVVLPEAITVGELANRMAERSADVIKELMKSGVMATVNETLDADTAELIVTEMGHNVKRVTEADVEIGLFGEEDVDKDLKARPPVITIMGHVDHGKTSLLDALRQADVVAGEAGGITQHIGAYQIQTGDGNRITFLDTPGHEAFTAMRARGAKVTDIVVLVVAADDGIMPQTIEAIQHAKAAEVPIIVAVNKVDKPDADPDRVKQELLQHEVIVEDMGGDVQCVEVSATKKQNLEGLIEAIVLQAELLELKANPDRGAEGIVIEATLEKGRGSVATVLITRGTLRVGDIFVAGAESGRVRALIDDRGEQIEDAGPAKPVEILGLNSTPVAGDDFAVVDSEARAREITDYRQRQIKERQVGGPKVSLESMLDKLKEKEIVELPVVIKADVHGSAEAITSSLEKLGTEEVAAKIVLSGVGGITESDVTLAEASGAPILGFNVRATGQARQLAEQQGVEIRYYSVIYELVDDVKAILSGMLAPEVREHILGYAEVRDVFPAGKGKAAGCLVTEGAVRSNAKARLLRDDVVVFEGQLQELRRFKDVVKEVNAGTECGMSFEGFNDIKTGDQIEVYEVEEKERTL